MIVLVDHFWDTRALSGQLFRANIILWAQARWPEEEKKVAEARATELASQLIKACLIKSYVAERERRVVASYKEFEGFYCGLECTSQVTYEFGYPITIRRFKAKYLELEIDEDPFAELPSDVEVLAPMEVPLDDHLVTPLALPPPS
ncbi:hypothetical protein GW17_00049403 [Ensete ventricosum]|nr:hypothetical protein GW17_00049403 [Ensete ventricosum]